MNWTDLTVAALEGAKPAEQECVGREMRDIAVGDVIERLVERVRTANESRDGESKGPAGSNSAKGQQRTSKDGHNAPPLSGQSHIGSESLAALRKGTAERRHSPARETAR